MTYIEIPESYQLPALPGTTLGFAVVDCILWTRKNNTAGSNGQFFGWRTESACMGACLGTMTCVAIDTGAIGCVLHHDIEDLTNTYSRHGITHFILNRQCLSTVTAGINRCYSARARVVTITFIIFIIIIVVIIIRQPDVSRMP